MIVSDELLNCSETNSLGSIYVDKTANVLHLHMNVHDRVARSTQARLLALM